MCDLISRGCYNFNESTQRVQTFVRQLNPDTNVMRAVSPSLLAGYLLYLSKKFQDSLRDILLIWLTDKQTTNSRKNIPSLA